MAETGARTSARPDICILVNTRSGIQSAERLETLRAACARHPNRFDIRPLSEGARIASEARRAREEGFAIIVAAGGDGTICAVAGALAGGEAALGVIPFGTFNYFARAHSIPEDVEAAVATLLAGQTAPLSLGRVNETVFLNNASLGAYSAVLMRRERIYRRWGRSRLAAFWSVFATLIRFRSSLRVNVRVDGALLRTRTPMVFAALNAYQLELFGLDGAECIRGGKLALFLAPDRGGLALLGFALRLALRTASAERDFELLCGREIEVETVRRHRRVIAHDGERSPMSAPFVFRVETGKLDVIVPAREQSAA